MSKFKPLRKGQVEILQALRVCHRMGWAGLTARQCAEAMSIRTNGEPHMGWFSNHMLGYCYGGGGEVAKGEGRDSHGLLNRRCVRVEYDVETDLGKKDIYSITKTGMKVLWEYEDSHSIKALFA